MTKYFTYDGSFTTPPCTEGVKWSVVADMCTIPAGLLEKILGYESMHGNYRHAQALNGRTIGGVLALADSHWYPSDNEVWATLNTDSGSAVSNRSSRVGTSGTSHFNRSRFQSNSSDGDR